MVESALKLLTVDEFITGYGDRDQYELIDGELIEMEPTGLHEQVSALIGQNPQSFPVLAYKISVLTPHLVYEK